MKKYLLLCFILIIPVFFFFVGQQQKEKMLPITIQGKETSALYLVEIADTAEKTQQGLMWRKSMPKNQGMLFVFPYPSIIKMWMKNTYIPLDMIFFNAQNEVICLRENALPLDESIISCPYPASKVLELNAGEIKARNIRLGDILLLK